MKITLTLLISFFVFTINAQEKTVKDSLKTKGLEVWEWHYDNGVLGEKGYLKDSLKEGEWKWYFKNEQLKAKGSYKLGKPIGSRAFYYPEGGLYCKGQYTDGKRDGKWIWYNINNKVNLTIVFDKGMVKSYAVFDETGAKIVKSKGSKEVTVTFTESYSYLDVFEVRLINPNGYCVYLHYGSRLGRKVNSKSEGEWIIYSSGGSIDEIRHYKNDKLHGIVKQFDNGKVRYKWTYKNGKKTGIYCSYYEENEKKKNKGRLKNGKPIGLWKSYYNTGKLENRRYYKNGKLDGNAKRYYETGKLKDITPYKNGKINGNRKEYYENGKLEYRRYYKNGKLDGNAKRYYETGKLKEITPYKNGKINGNRKKYYENGILKENTYIENGDFSKLHQTFYHQNGQIYKTGYSNNGTKYGVWKWFYEDGQLKEINHYKDGEEDGENKSYYPNGQLKLSGYHKNGNRDGWFTYYKEDGKPKSATKYRAGFRFRVGEKSYYDNGQLKVIKRYYRPGVVAWKYYYPNGKLERLSYYLGREDADDAGFYYQEKTGVWKNFAKDGKLLQEITFEHDEMNGKHILYYNNKIHSVLLWEYGRLKEVLSCVDANGNPLPKGTLKDGNGEVLEYYKAAKLMNKVLIKDGKVADGHFFIRMVWNDQKRLNSYAWHAYENETNIEKLDFAIIWIERAIALEKNYYNMDTYAALLFKTGKKQQALKIANEAIAIAKKEDIDYKATEKLIEKFNR